MSFIEKLTIQGIRSFGCDRDDIGMIEFSSPLTLILGQNGCGKTTILEALKYAICGALPAGEARQSGGQVFIHDPKLVSTVITSVKGQVKLRLKDVKGELMSIVRTAVLEQKEKKMQFKSLDQTISRRKSDQNGWESISNRCLDVDSEMCLAVGVTKAVLCNVLLCVQEDSNWPLDENSKVKQKFDEIFGSDKYNVCLDQIRIRRKGLVQDEKLLLTQLVPLKNDTIEASSKRIALNEAESRLADCNEKIAAFKSQIDPILDQLNQLSKKEDEIMELKSKLGIKETQLQEVRSRIKELKSVIKEIYSGDQEQLAEEIRNFHSGLGNKQEELESVEKQVDEISFELKKNSELINDEQFKIWQLSKDIERNKELIEQRNRDVLSLSTDLGITTSLTQLSDSEEIHRIFTSLEEGIHFLDSEIALLQEEQKRDVAKLQGEMDSSKEVRAKLEYGLDSKKENLRKNKEELKKIKSDIFEVDQSAELLGSLQTKLDRVCKELDDLLKNNDSEKLQGEIEASQSVIRQYEQKISDLVREIGALQQFCVDQAQLDIHNNKKAATDKEIRRLKELHSENLLQLLEEIPEQGIKFQLDLCMDKYGDEIKALTTELKKIETDITELNLEKKHTTEKLNKLKQNLESDEYQIQRACSNRDYNEYLTEIGKKVQELQDEKGTLASSEFMLKRFVSQLQQQKPCCPLCKRNFKDEEEATKLVSELSMKVKENPSKLRSNKEQLETNQEKYNSLLQLKPKQDKLSVIRNIEIPGLQNDLEKIDKKLHSLLETRERLENEIDIPQRKDVLAKNMLRDVIILEQSIGESRKLERLIQKLEMNRPVGTKRSMEEALEEQKDVQSKLSTARRNCEALEKKCKFIDAKRNELHEEKNSIRDQQLKISGKAQMRSQLFERQNELENLEGLLQMEIDESVTELATVKRQIDNQTREMKSLVSNNATQLNEKRKTLSKMEQKFQDIKTKNETIMEYELSDADKRMSSLKQVLLKLQGKEDSYQNRKDSLVEKCDKIKTDITTQKMRERELLDNEQLLNKINEERTLISAVGALNKRIGNMDFSCIQEEKNILKNKEDKLRQGRSVALGGKLEVEKTIETISSELQLDRYKNADKNLQDKTIELEVVKFTMQDLDNYFNALEWAILSYHTKKMEHINRVARELWMSTYAGSDIDYIAIKAERDESTAATTRRSFKYRVVQVKCGVELEMRGRCSAGQKVLACLIIRIALAETFSANCGLLALDEPTTNLDQQNIRNLGETLDQIVRSQRERRNFQLIVISHDQDFIDSMSRSEGGIDYYYELERDATGSKSRIIKKFTT